ncbi:MAG: site-specific integrase [Nocardioides sp.]|uniref:tyrosine-type recombinase/integrase n=1 Tax=Nocardioides sp. TaxID=35761 RepID=UPI002621A414|nr:site-specific integrase [Nocardioides sp.]MCW2833194.1 site-specific integrase [Nocardioides sp.]
MSRPRIPIGTSGSISFIVRGKTRVEARARYRDWDGQTRLIQATASSRPAAEVALKRKLAERNAFQPVDTTLTPTVRSLRWSTTGWPTSTWKPGARRRRGSTTSATSIGWCCPRSRASPLREIGVARCDALLKQLGSGSYSSAKRPRTVLRQSFALAVRHEVLVRNPIDNVSRLHKPKRTPTALTATEVNAIRAVIRAWEQSAGASGPNPDGQRGQIVEVMLGTSARIGEVLAIRRRDLDLTTTPATLRICGTVISERGVGTYRQGHPTTDRSNRVIALPSFTAEALRRRLAIMADHSLDALVFRSREGTPLTTANVRRQLRKVLGDAGVEGVTPHMFRRTVATVLNEQASLNLASELLGHTDPRVMIEHYIRRSEQVNPLTAELLDAEFARDNDE